MAPPDRGDKPQREDSLAELHRAGLAEASGSRLSGTANKLASWVEWMRHPEDHGYDRTLTGNDEEVPGPVLDSVAVPGPGMPRPPQAHPSPVPVAEDAQWPFESVIAKYNLAQLLDGMAAVATQVVESPSSVLALSAAVMKNVWWLGDARDNFEQLAADFVKACEAKFHSKDEGVSIDVLGMMAATIAAGATVFVTRGAALPLIKEAVISQAWSETFTEFFKKAGGAAKEAVQGKVNGPLWRDLARSYMVTHSDITHRTIGALNDLTEKIKAADAQFENDIEPYLEKWAQG